ncbi:MAG TPA: M13 family metallopeptidase [Steroidobacteraceae bacterium]|nr:M13 family metallopeptidase [Steroidobacteraceae bacterium]
MKHSNWLVLGGLALSCGALAAMAAKSGLDPTAFDTHLRPQDDLYQYANGTWLAKTEIPADLASYGSFVMLDDASRNNVHGLLEELLRKPQPPGSEPAKVADFYRSYMDTTRIDAAGLKPLAPELARIDAISSAGDVASYMGYNQGIGVNEPLQWSVQQDARNATAYVVELDQSGLTLPDRDYYLREDARFADYRQKYATYITSLMRLAGDRDAATAAATIQGIEKQIATAHWSRVQNRDPVATYNKMTLADLEAKAPGVDWARFFAATGAPGDVVVVSQPSYLTVLGQLFQTVSVADWKTYFRFKLIDDYAPFLGHEFEDLRFDFHSRTLSGVQQPPPRWKRGVGVLNGNMGEAVGKVYVARYFTAESKRRIGALVQNLLRTYQQAIDQLEWMGPETRQQAQAKLAAIAVKLGYPDKWRDYSTLTIAADDLIGNVTRAQQFEHRRFINKLGKPVDRSEWGLTPQTVNAQYNPVMNDITFPAAILQPPFFDPGADDAVNYGAIGAVIGHEISHGFDDLGSQFDGQGNLRNWWTPDDAAKFKQRTNALVAQFNAYTILDDQHVNGQLTLGENIADLSGLSIAYRAYQLSLRGRPAPVIGGYTGAQRFFLGWATIWRNKNRDDRARQLLTIDPHSPTQFRGDGPPSNIDAFYDAFSVKPGDKMYRAPADRVKIW